MTRHRLTPRRAILTAGLIAALGAEALAATAPFAAAPRDLPNPPPGETQLEAPRPAAPLLSASAPAERAPEGNPLWAVPLSRLSATRERPLFAPARRAPPPAVAATPPPAAPPPPPPAPPKPAEPDRPQLSLVGTVSGEDDGIAVFVDSASKAVLRLKTGETHKGWTLRAVLRREARFEKGRETAVLSLPSPAVTAGGAPPPGHPFGAPPPPAPPRR